MATISGRTFEWIARPFAWWPTCWIARCWWRRTRAPRDGLPVYASCVAASPAPSRSFSSEWRCGGRNPPSPPPATSTTASLDRFSSIPVSSCACPPPDILRCTTDSRLHLRGPDRGLSICGSCTAPGLRRTPPLWSAPSPLPLPRRIRSNSEEEFRVSISRYCWLFSSWSFIFRWSSSTPARIFGPTFRAISLTAATVHSRTLRRSAARISCWRGWEGSFIKDRLLFWQRAKHRITTSWLRAKLDRACLWILCTCWLKDRTFANARGRWAAFFGSSSTLGLSTRLSWEPRRSRKD